MYRKSKKLLAWSLVVCMIVTQMLFSSVALAADKAGLATDRFAGTDRYQTAIEVSKAGWTTSQYAVLAYGEVSADALAAAPLAKKLGAPILLTDKGALSAGVLAELQRLGVTEVYIVGGEGAVSKAVEDAVLAAGMDTTRLWGTDRYMTALAVAQEMGTPDTVAVVNGELYADALSISAVAAAKGWPVLLTGKDAMDADVKAYIGSKKVYVVGGAGVVSDAVLNQFSGAVRLGGVDRYDTNLKVLEQFAADLNFLNVFMATGEGFADALAGSVLAANYASPLVLVGTSVAPATLSFLGGKVTSETGVFAFGGSAVVSNSAVNAVKPVAPTGFRVESVSALSLNQIQVKFNKAFDKDSAKDLSLYTLKTGAPNGTNALLSNTSAWTGTPAVKLADDNKSLVITLDADEDGILDPVLVNQYTANVLIKNVKSADLSEVIADTTVDFAVLDATAPTVEGATSMGNKILKVKFSEEVQNITASSTAVVAASSYRLNGNSLHTYGLSGITYDSDSRTATLSFTNALPAGDYKLEVSHDNAIMDMVGLRLMQTEVSVSVTNNETAGKVQSVVVDADKTYIDIEFSKALASTSDAKNTALTISAANGTLVNILAAQSAGITVNVKDGKLRVTGSGANFTAITGPGTHAVNLYNSTSNDIWVKDAYGVKYEESSTSYSITADYVKPTVVSVVQATSTAIDVTYSKAVTDTAINKYNYTIKNSSDTVQPITSVEFKSGNQNKVVRINLTSAPTSGDYKVSISGVRSTSGNNLMDAYETTIAIGDTVGPTIVTNGVEFTGQNVYVTFSKNMDSTTATNAANYQFKGEALPSGTSLTMISSNQVKIVFPVATTVAVGNLLAVSGNVKDAVGNPLQGFGQSMALRARTDIITVAAWDSNPIRVTGRNKLEFKLDKELQSIVPASFTVNGTPATNASFINADGKAKVELTMPTDFFRFDGTVGGAAATLTLVAGQNTLGFDGRGLNAGAVGTAADYIAPELVSTTANQVRAYDVDEDGFLDHIVVEFTEAMNNAYMSLASFKVAGYKVLSVATDNAANIGALVGTLTTATTAGNGTNGNFAVIVIEERTGSNYDTGATPAVTFVGTMKDAARGNEFVLPTSAKVATDLAAPVLVGVASSATLATGNVPANTVFTLTFSETVVSNATITNADFTTTQALPDGATITWATTGGTVKATFTTATTGAGWLTTDTMVQAGALANAHAIEDTAGNDAVVNSAGAVTISGL